MATSHIFLLIDPEIPYLLANPLIYQK